MDDHACLICTESPVVAETRLACCAARAYCRACIEAWLHTADATCPFCRRPVSVLEPQTRARVVLAGALALLYTALLVYEVGYAFYACLGSPNSSSSPLHLWILHTFAPLIIAALAVEWTCVIIPVCALHVVCWLAMPRPLPAWSVTMADFICGCEYRTHYTVIAALIAMQLAFLALLASLRRSHATRRFIYAENACLPRSA